MDDIAERLFDAQDPGYRDYSAKLIPNVDRGTVIGVRSPELKRIAAEISKRGDAAGFLAELPHRYLEENILHGILISRMKDYAEAADELERFLPYVDNWAVCDTIKPKPFKKRPPELIDAVRRWLGSERTYMVRFGIGVLMSYYLDDGFEPEYADMVASMRSEEYYVNMMIAWYFATALAKQYDCAVKYIENRSLDTWTHNKTIQKALESFRISEERKEYLRTLKIERKHEQ